MARRVYPATAGLAFIYIFKGILPNERRLRLVSRVARKARHIPPKAGKRLIAIDSTFFRNYATIFQGRRIIPPSVKQHKKPYLI